MDMDKPYLLSRVSLPQDGETSMVFVLFFGKDSKAFACKDNSSR